MLPYNNVTINNIELAQHLLHRAATLPNTVEGKQQEREHVIKALTANSRRSF